MTHYDLFAGIGGFSLAIDEVFYEQTIKHVFCEWEQFPTQVLKQHWPKGIYYGDIAQLVTDSECQGRKGCSGEDTGRCRQLGREIQNQEQSILTGGFPCQPFSAAGRRRGTSDDRYKWPEMFEVIRNVKPDWVVAENVRGLVTWNEGMVLEQVCSDLESEGYEVQPFIIPAVAVNAPHRRDRVWIIANLKHNGKPRTKNTGKDSGAQPESPTRSKLSKPEYAGASSLRKTKPRRQPNWNAPWQEVAFATCDDSVDDGLPRIVDGVSISRAKWRQNSLKAYGNGIVHQVATVIFEAIKLAKESKRIHTHLADTNDTPKNPEGLKEFVDKVRPEVEV